MPGPPHAPSLRADLGVLAAVYVVSRIVYALSGARFDARDLDAFWHFLPLDLLQHRLWESLFYSHFQPPLYNLYLGTMVQAFGAHAPLAFALSYWLAGALGMAALYLLMRALYVARAIAFGATALFWISPPALLFESYLFYTLPLTVALIVAAFLLHRALVRPSSMRWGLVFATLAGIVLTRTLFHPLWLVAVVGACALGAGTRQVLRGAALPLLVVAAVCAKNWVLFDSFGTSSWFGIGLARMTVRDFPERERWIAEGRLSPLAGIRPPGSVDAYAPLLPPFQPTGIPLLDRPEKRPDVLNLHHGSYVAVSKVLRGDALAVLRARPDVYARSVFSAFRRFLAPSSSWHPLAPNRRAIAGYADGYDALFHFGGLYGRSGLWLFLLPAVTFWAARRLARASALGISRAETGLTAFLVSTIVYVTLVGCLFEPNENMRFRFMIDPYLWTLCALFLTRGSPFLECRTVDLSSVRERARRFDPRVGPRT